MAFCTKCGAKNSDDAKFCGSCGEKIEKLFAENEKNFDGVNRIQEMFLKTSGRLNRLRYFKRLLVVFLAVFVPIFVISSITVGIYRYVPQSVSVIIGILSILSMFPTYCLMTRRLQDLNKDNKLAIVYVVLQVVYFSLASDPFHPSNAVFVVIIGLALFASFAIWLSARQS